MGEPGQKLPMGLPLERGERVLLRTHTFFRWWFWPTRLIVLAIPAYIRRLKNRYDITSKKIVITEGWLKKHQRILSLEKVQNVNLTQGFLARWLGYGSIVIETAGETSNEALPSANQARKFRDVVLLEMGDDDGV